MRNPNTAADDLLSSYLIASGIDSLIVRKWKSAEIKTLPEVIINSFKSVPVSNNYGSFQVDSEIIVRTNSNPDVDETTGDIEGRSIDLVDSIINALMRFGDGEQSSGSISDEITKSALSNGHSDLECISFEITEINTDIERNSDAWTDKITTSITLRFL